MNVLYALALRVNSSGEVRFPSIPNQVLSIDGVDNCIDSTSSINEIELKSRLPVSISSAYFKIVLNGVMCCSTDPADTETCNQLCDSFSYVNANGTIRQGGIESLSFSISDTEWKRNLTRSPYEYSAVLEASDLKGEDPLLFFIRDQDCRDNSGVIDLSIYESL